MEILFVILPVALLISVLFLVSFIYNVKKGQYDDLDTPAYRILLEDKKINNKLNEEESL